MSQQLFHVRFRLPYDAEDLQDRETLVLSRRKPGANDLRRDIDALRNADIFEVTPLEPADDWQTVHCGETVDV